MTTNERSSIRFHLLGAAYPDGEIPLTQLARIAEHAQSVVTRIARIEAGQGSAGRTRQPIADGTRLMLVGLAAGSTQLVIAAPERDPQLPLGRGHDELVDRALVELTEALAQAAQRSSLSDRFDPSTRRHLADFLDALSDAAPEVEISTRISAQTPTALRFSPSEARENLEIADPDPKSPPSVTVVEGVLYSANLHTHHYRIEDDLGSSIQLSGGALDSMTIGNHLGRRVRVEGLAERDHHGRVITMKPDKLTAGPKIPGVDDTGFWSDEAEPLFIHEAGPIESIDDFGIEGVDDQEITEFLKAIQG